MASRGETGVLRVSTELRSEFKNGDERSQKKALPKATHFELDLARSLEPSNRQNPRERCIFWEKEIETTPPKTNLATGSS